MPRPFYKIIFIAALALAAPSACAATWQISETVDEISDELSYLVHAPGSVVRTSEYMSYRPELVVKVTPKGSTNAGGMKYVGDVMIQIETDGLTRGQCEITTRYNRDSPATEIWTTSSDRRAAFSRDWKTTISKLAVSTNLTARYTTTLGRTRTTTFNVAGLTNALKQVKALYFARHKK
jgi:hypothetical protein